MKRKKTLIFLKSKQRHWPICVVTIWSGGEVNFKACSTLLIIRLEM